LFCYLIYRFLLANLLIPKIRTAVDKGEDGRVLTVLAAGKGGAIDLEDLGLKKNASIKRKADSATTYNDLIVEVDSRRPAFTYLVRNSRSVTPVSRSRMLILAGSIQILSETSHFISDSRIFQLRLTLILD